MELWNQPYICTIAANILGKHDDMSGLLERFVTKASLHHKHGNRAAAGGERLIVAKYLFIKKSSI